MTQLLKYKLNPDGLSFKRHTKCSSKVAAANRKTVGIKKYNNWFSQMRIPCNPPGLINILEIKMPLRNAAVILTPPLFMPLYYLFSKVVFFKLSLHGL